MKNNKIKKTLKSSKDDANKISKLLQEDDNLLTLSVDNVGNIHDSNIVEVEPKASKSFLARRKEDFPKEKKTKSIIFYSMSVIIILGMIGLIIYYFLKK